MSLLSKLYSLAEDNIDLLNELVNYKSEVVIISLVAVPIAIWSLKTIRNQLDSQTPSGPWGLPIVGYFPFLADSPLKTLTKLGSRYGDVFKLSMFGRDFYVLHSPQALREGFDRGDVMNGRPEEFNCFQLAFDRIALQTINGPNWKPMRKFVIHHTSSMANMNYLEPRIVEIGHKLVDFLSSNVGTPIDLRDTFNNCALNATNLIVLNRDFNWDDELMSKIRTSSIEIFASLPLLDTFLVGPWFRLLKANSYVSSGFRKFLLAKKECLESIGVLIDQEIAKFNPKAPGDGLMSQYLLEMSKEAAKGEQAENMWSREHVIRMLLGFYAAGTDTTSETLYVGIHLLVKNPQIQKRIQEELDSVVGIDREPEYKGRNLLPYTQAVIEEIIRWTSIAPLGAIRTSIEDTVICGYKIPKGANVIGNLWTSTRSAEHFKNPDNFDPENFLAPDGSFKSNRGNLTFSLGKRDCTGEILARLEIFIFLTMMMQKFTFTAPGGDLSTFDRSFTDGLIHIMDRYQVCVNPRNY